MVNKISEMKIIFEKEKMNFKNLIYNSHHTTRTKIRIYTDCI